MELTKSTKLKIKRPLNATWKEVNPILEDLKYYSAKIMNHTIQKCYEWMNFRLKYKEEHGCYPKEKDIFNNRSFQNSIYRDCREKFPIIYSKNLMQTILFAKKRWDTDEKDILRLKKSIPSFKLDCPIIIANQPYFFAKEDDMYILDVGLLSQKSNSKTRFRFEIYCRDKSTKAILDRLIKGKYNYGFAQIVKEKNKWFVIASYKFSSQEKKLDRNKILGIDLGINYPVYMAISDSWHRYKIKGGEIEQFRRSIEQRKKDLLHQGRYCGSGRIGRGIKTRIKPADFARKRVTNFRNTVNHKYSRFVVEIALKHQCGVIQMECLEGISKDSTFLKRWSYYDLQQKIEYKAKEHGIEVRYINPEYTSQRCSRCGYIDSRNRPDQKTFKCVNCGFETHADYNAARNIATPNIEELIKETLKKQKTA